MNKQLFGVVIAVLFYGQSFAADDINNAAKDVCECLKAPHEQARLAVDLIEKAQSSGDLSQLASAQAEIMGVIQASQNCFEALTIKYPEVNKSEKLQTEVMNKAQQNCPSPMTQ